MRWGRSRCKAAAVVLALGCASAPLAGTPAVQRGPVMRWLEHDASSSCSANGPATVRSRKTHVARDAFDLRGQPLRGATTERRGPTGEGMYSIGIAYDPSRRVLFSEFHGYEVVRYTLATAPHAPPANLVTRKNLNVATRAGFGIGSPEASVRARFGVPAELEPRNACGISTYRYDASPNGQCSHLLEFTFGNGRVISITDESGC